MNSFFVFFFFSTAWYFLSKFPYTQVSFCFFLGKNAKHRIEILFNSIHL